MNVHLKGQNNPTMTGREMTINLSDTTYFAKPIHRGPLNPLQGPEESISRPGEQAEQLKMQRSYLLGSDTEDNDQISPSRRIGLQSYRNVVPVQKRGPVNSARGEHPTKDGLGASSAPGTAEESDKWHINVECGLLYSDSTRKSAVTSDSQYAMFNTS